MYLSHFYFKEDPMRQRRKLLLSSALMLLVVPMMNCGSGHSADERYFFVTTNVKLPYWQSAGNGFIQEAKQWKLRADFVGPDTYDPNAELDEFRKAVQAKPSGILVSAADAKLLKEDIDNAIAA
jgi:ribose transport system substrate-binding protein